MKSELTLDCLLHLDTDIPKYVADIKAVCHFTNFSNVIDLQQAEFQKQGNLVDNQIFLTTSHRFFHSKGMNNFCSSFNETLRILSRFIY